MQLSYSSASLLSNCEQRYAHRKILKTPIDSDADDSTEAFDLGKAFHKVLEDTLHTRISIPKNTELACKEFNVTEQQGLIEGMVENYLNMHEASGLECILSEFEISEPNTIGYIDAIMKDSNGNWWIVDLKTAARWNESILSRLPKDYQLNLYSSFRGRIADLLDLNLMQFMGCRYRVTTKSKAMQKATESYEAYVKRIARAVKTYDVIVPVNIMAIDEIRALHESNHARAMELSKGILPKKNLSYCESYFRPCEYFSQCHGCNFTESKDRVQIKTADIYIQEQQDVEDL